ncbi:hypothetical protein EVAR_37263_1 [Eumeta japonica]|uniref:Uncharacterized protein n=1 Tax=Eumeta variegata TaxID=151549 RepID=A0A4C1WMT0_EUMVA|nr:hypothetical protein EVAR_37263_1 [Eumeta japonica]
MLIEPSELLHSRLRYASRTAPEESGGVRTRRIHSSGRRAMALDLINASRPAAAARAITLSLGPPPLLRVNYDCLIYAPLRRFLSWHLSIETTV